MRIILAGNAGGIAMFIWSFCSHTVLPLGEVGVRYVDHSRPARFGGSDEESNWNWWHIL